MQSRFDLIVFDCDGVLVDSERIVNTVFVVMLNELGLKLTLADMFDKFVGNSMPACLKLVEEMLGRPVSAGFVTELTARSHRALEAELLPVDGIEEALESVHIPYCVASSGDHVKMRKTLGLTGLLPRFEGKLFSVTEVARGKPFPDVFLYAAARHGVDPSRCAVIEDTPIGVRAGVASGMTVFGYAKHTPVACLMAQGAFTTFDDMRALPQLLART